MPERPVADTSILIVEDDAASARMIAALLASEGVTTVRVAHSAEEAQAILATMPIHVLIVDVVLPRMSGLELVRHVKANPATCCTTAIVITGDDEDGMQRDARDSGCAAFLRKPVDIDKLLDVVIACSAHQRSASGGAVAVKS